MPDNGTDRRPFDMPDADAMARCSAMHKALEARQAAFALHDPMFGGTYPAQWATAIAACYAIETDEAMLDLLQSYTQAVAGAMAQGNAALADLRYFAQKAYGGTRSLQAFRFGAHAKVRMSSSAYVLYLRTQHALAVQLTPALAAKGMTPAHTAALATAADAIATTDLAQEVYKRQRLLATAQRHTLLNAMWAFARQTHAAAEVIYADDAAVRGLFALG